MCLPCRVTPNSMLLTLGFDCAYSICFSLHCHSLSSYFSIDLVAFARQKDTLWMEFMCKSYQCVSNLKELLPLLIHSLFQSLASFVVFILFSPFRHSFSFISLYFSLVFVMFHDLGFSGRYRRFVPSIHCCLPIHRMHFVNLFDICRHVLSLIFRLFSSGFFLLSCVCFFFWLQLHPVLHMSVWCWVFVRDITT